MGIRRHIVSALIALAAVMFGLFASGLSRTLAEPKVAIGGHTLLSLEQAIAFAYCGKYGYLGPSSLDAGYLEPSKRIASSIEDKYGSVQNWCNAPHKKILNNENSSFLLFTALLSLPFTDTFQMLTIEVVIFKAALLFLVFYILALNGVGLLPLAFIGFVAGTMINYSQQVYANLLQPYPIMSIVLLATSALLVLLFQALRLRSVLVLGLTAIVVGFAFGFVYNLRTAYGFVIVGQFLALLTAAAIHLRAKPAKLARYGVAVAGVVAGFLAFEAGLIFPLHKDQAASNYSYHSIWHPIVLGVSIPANDLAEREGIKWDDSAGTRLAQKADPKVQYLDPNYDKALRAYWVSLWRDYPSEMRQIYVNKVYELSRTMATGLGYVFQTPTLTTWLQTIVPNGFAWFGVIVAAGLLALGLLRLAPPLAMFTICLTAALFAVSVEQSIVMPVFNPPYQNSLVVGFAALLSLIVAFLCKGLFELGRAVVNLARRQRDPSPAPRTAPA